MCASTTTTQQSSTSVGSPTFSYLIEVEANLRRAGRLLEWAGVADEDSRRMGMIVFRLASRVRENRTGERAA